MIETTVAKWHQHLRGQLPGGLDELLHDDVVFFSPIVFTPQRGKDVTKLYLSAAGQTLGGDGPAAGDEGAGADAGPTDVASSTDSAASPAPTRFRYLKEVMAGNHAMLEFETSMDGLYVNGIDIITCDDDGKIIEFKVMIRPLQAINAVHAQMRAMLEKMAPPA